MEPTHPESHSAAEPAPVDVPAAGTRFRVRWLAETTSTNAVVAAAATDGEPEGLVVAADFQSAGRGRLGRTWTAPSGSALLCSFLLRPPSEDVHLAVTAVACAAADACRRTSGFEPALKWPNDLVVDCGLAWRKLGGILAEAVTDGDRVIGVVVGVGLNVVQTPGFPDSLADTSTFLSLHSSQVPAPRDLLGVMCEALESHYRTLLERPAELMADYRGRCATIGQRVRVEQPGSTWEGDAVDVADDGALEVRTDGGVRRVDAGDVVHLRPA